MRRPVEPAEWIDAVPVRSGGRPGCAGSVLVGLLFAALAAGVVLLLIRGFR